MPELGKYAVSIYAAWGATLGLMAALILFTWWQSRRARRLLDAAEARRAQAKES